MLTGPDTLGFVDLPGQYRGRLAPSPTGLLHLGHAATFWTASQRALSAGGDLVLRMEDLDPQRSRPEFAAAALEDLHWLGIRWNEGPDIGGRFTPYEQSHRTGLYEAAMARLIAAGAVYPCSCTRKDLTRMAQAPHDEELIYPGTCRPGATGAVGGGHTADSDAYPSPSSFQRNWRFRVPEGAFIGFEDCSFGAQRFLCGEDFGDFLVWRKDGVPAYQLAVAVDDAAMQITEVVRGADLLRSTARQILLCRSLDFPEPRWYHCPLLRDQNGQRLAKRHDALSLRALRASGVGPEEVLRRAAAGIEAPSFHRGPDL